MVRVKFNDHKDFIEELQKEYSAGLNPCLQAPILRITGQKSGRYGPIRHIYVCATIENPRGDILRLERYCGHEAGRPHADDKAKKIYDDIRAELVSIATGLGLEVRSGVIEGGVNGKTV